MILTVNNVPVTKLNVFLKMLRVFPRPLRIGFVLPPGAPLLREWIEPNALDILAGVACGMNNLQTIVNAEYQPHSSTYVIIVKKYFSVVKVYYGLVY